MRPGELLEVATPEAVALQLDVAGLGHRALAWCADAALIATFWFTLLFAVSYVRTYDLTRLGSLGATVQILLVVSFFATNWGYALGFEALWHGQTPGKRLLGLRVVRADGSPAAFTELALRNLCRAIDFLPVFYLTGAITLVVTQPSRRLGDLLAGTLVVRERRFDLNRYQAPPPTQRPDLAPLAPAQLELVLEFLSRANGMELAARSALALQISAIFAARLPESERLVLSDAAAAEAYLQSLARGES